MRKFIQYDNRAWTVHRLARVHGLPPSTLHNRLNRFGATATGIARALATGTMSASRAGSIGASRSYWRNL